MEPLRCTLLLSWAAACWDAAAARHGSGAVALHMAHQVAVGAVVARAGCASLRKSAHTQAPALPSAVPAADW